MKRRIGVTFNIILEISFGFIKLGSSFDLINLMSGLGNIKLLPLRLSQTHNPDEFHLTEWWKETQYCPLVQSSIPSTNRIININPL